MDLARRRLLLGLAAPLASSVGLAADPVIRRRLRFTVTFSNPFSRTLAQQTFWYYLPGHQTPNQRWRGVEVSMAYQLHEDALGQRILELSFDSFPPLSQRVVTFAVEVELLATAQPQPLGDPVSWLTAERFIESDDPRIRALAAELRRAKPRDTALAIFEWVQRSLSYAGYLADDMGALQALLQRRGDCTEYADLVVALARANGLPARMVGGFVTDRDLAPRPQDYHNWAEVYVDGAWRLVDAQKGNWLQPVDQYVAVRIYRDVAINPVGSANRYRIQGDLQVAF